MIVRQGHAVASGSASPHQLHASAEEDAKIFLSQVAERMARFPDLANSILEAGQRHADLVCRMHQDGFVILRNYFSPEKVHSLRTQVERLVLARKHLAPVRAHFQESDGDLMNGTYRYLSEPFLRNHEGALESLVSSVGIQDPLINLGEVSDMVFDLGIIEMATAFYGAIPLVTFLKTRYAFANAVPPADTQYFHADGGSYRIFKALIYLNDVEAGGGPFCFVKGSHRRKWEGWDGKARYEDAEIEKIYGTENMIRCYANAGDLILANTTGFHRGEKPTRRNRGILIVNYCVHPEYGFEHPAICIHPNVKCRLTSLAQRAAEHLVEVATA